MVWFSRKSQAARSGPALVVEKLDVHYGQAHALQEVSLTLEKGILAVVGRNGMGKTTLCNAVTGLVPSRGSVRLNGQEIRGLPPHVITTRGVGYVPQGRRVWPSLTVHEHLRLAEKSASRGAWTVDRIYQSFPRLAERKDNGGAQLSGGEQQMLAISRALLFNPTLLVMDEPTEGLAPVIVQHVENMLREIVADGQISILLIEQNLGVAIDIADDVAVMVNGRIAHRMPAREIAADRELQTRLLGIRQSDADEDDATSTPSIEMDAAASDSEPIRVFTVKRHGDIEAPSLDEERVSSGFNRWNATSTTGRPIAKIRELEPIGSKLTPHTRDEARVLDFPVSHTINRAAYIAGTFDTKGRELFYLQNCIERLGLRTITVDLSTTGTTSPANVSAQEVARHHPDGARAVFSGDRGSAVAAMTLAFERFIASRRDVGGLISAGGSGGTALATAAMRRLPIGVPKVMVSTVASGDVRPYVGPSDICMMYSVTDVSGLNRISERVLANAAHALAGMIAHAREASAVSKLAVGLSMFGVTTPCVQAVAKQLEGEYDCLVFHATGTGGQSMEKLAESGMLSAVLDLTTTEFADELFGGVLSAGPERMDVFARHRIPYIGSCGALDMVNFWAIDTVPTKYRDRNLYKHNPNVTLMRTTRAECEQLGNVIAKKLNAMIGPVRFLIPEGGVSMLDAPGQPFHDPDADAALFNAIEANFRASSDRKLIKSKHHINDVEFSDAVVAEFRALANTLNTVKAA
jgi:uncharacterized protein (UPF0261 family)/ABC-type branched-subunit amino acid transport system ATPase component